MKQQVLISELGNQMIPNVRMWVTDRSIFWISENQGPIWISSNSGLEDYIDENHPKEYREKMGEEVGNIGCEWMNQDFSIPFDISDFVSRIETINYFYF